MARFSIISKDGDKIRYEGKPRYIGTYLKPSYLEFSEIASPTPIDWQVGDYVDYPRTGMRYRLYSIPQASKNARKGSHGRAFTYSNVQLHAATKELEIALFKDLVSADNNIHFSTSPDVATFENVYGIARRIQACMDDLYPNRWFIQVADFDASEDAEILEKINTAKDFALSGGTCLDALTKIYELWQEVGWIHTYDSASGKDVITIGYANKRIGANTTEPYIYGKGNGLTAIKKTQANKDEFATRLYVYGSDRNLPSRYYNDKNILNAESLDIRNLMLPIAEWGKTSNRPDARKAYLENAEAVAKYGVIPKTHYFDSDDAGADIYPSIEGMTIGQVRNLAGVDYRPSTSVYPSNSERVDEIKAVVKTPRDNGVLNRGGNTYQYSSNEHIPATYEVKKVPKVAGDFEILTNYVLYQSVINTDFYQGEIVFQPTLQCVIPDAEFNSVSAKVTLGDEVNSDDFLIRSKKVTTISAQKNDSGDWVFDFKDMSAKYDGSIYDAGFPINLYVSITVNKEATKNEHEIQIQFSGGSAFLGIKEILEKSFSLRLKQIGFDISEKANQGQGKTISMKTGDCQGRNFVISSCVYVPWLDSWDLTLSRQQDDSLGILFPNTDTTIKAGDRFVLLDIAMPDIYVEAAMDRLLSEGEKLLSRVSRIRNNYEPSIDAKVMIESGRTIREGMFMQISDEDVVDDNTEYILIDTVNIYEDEAAIPTYKVTLKEKKKVSYKGTPSATSVSNTRSAGEGAEVNVDLSNYVTKEQFKSIEGLKDMFYKYDENTIGTKFNFFSEKEVSAKGLSLDNETSEGGLIQNVLGQSSLGSVESDDNTTTFNAYAIDLIYKKVVELEQNGGGTGGGGGTGADLSNYYTKLQTDVAIAAALEPYAKTEDLDGKYAPLAGFNTLQSDFDALNKALNDDVSGKINTWNEIVDFLDEYSGSESLAVILEGMNADIGSRVLQNTYSAFLTDEFNPLKTKVDSFTDFSDDVESINLHIRGIDETILAIQNQVDGYDSKITALENWKESVGSQITINKENIDKILGWFKLDSNGNLYTEKNFYSTNEISANGLSGGGSGGGLISSVLGKSALGTVTLEDNSITFNAFAIDSLYKRIIALEQNGGGTGGDLTDYYTKKETDSAISSALTSTFTKVNIKSTLGIYDWALASKKPSYAWSEITSRPTNLSEFTDDLVEGHYMPLAGGTITGNLRLKGSGNYGNYLYFGDGSYCYLQEDTDDHLKVYASKGVSVITGSGYGLTVNGAALLTEDSLDGYATENWVTNKGYVTETWVTNKGYITSSALSGYATQTWVTNKGYITSSALTGYATQTWVTTQGYATQTWVNNKGYLTSSSLNGYATQTWVNTQLDSYLPLAGGTITGNLTVNGYAKIGSATLTWKSSALEVNKPFYSTGEISANGLYTSSDIRFKNKAEDVILDIDTIANAPMFKFTWNNKEDGKMHIGSSAQYWKEYASELVSVDKDDFHRLDYATLGVLMGVTLGKKAKNHEERIKELELKVESLEAENRRLRYEC